MGEPLQPSLRRADLSERRPVESKVRRGPGGPATVRQQIFLLPEQRDQVREWAADSGLTISEVFRQLIDRHRGGF